LWRHFDELGIDHTVVWEKIKVKLDGCWRKCNVRKRENAQSEVLQYCRLGHSSLICCLPCIF
jgi:hypothetical protein